MKGMSFILTTPVHTGDGGKGGPNPGYEEKRGGSFQPYTHEGKETENLQVGTEVRKKTWLLREKIRGGK